MSTRCRHGLAPLVPAMLAIALLTGCGQKGPLFLPTAQQLSPLPVMPESAVIAPQASASAAQ